MSSSRVNFDAPGPGGEARALMADLELSTPLVVLCPPDPDSPPPPPTEVLRGYVLYSVCQADGTCVFRRQELEAIVRFPAPPRGEGEEPGGGETEGDDR